MKTKLNNKSQFESAPFITQGEQTEYFVKLPYRFQKEDWFKNPIKRMVFTELCFKANWQDTSITFKNQKCIVRKGECVIIQRDVAKELNIPVAKLNRVLKFLTEIQEIETRKTNVFTLVSIPYLREDTNNETPVKHQRNTRNVKFNNLKDVIDALDNIDKIDNNINEKQVFVEEEINLNKTEEKEMATISQIDSTFKDGANENNSVKAKKKDNTFVETLLNIWSEEYYLSRQLNYVVIQGKDTGAISKLIKLFKSEQPDLDTQGMIEYFRNFCKQVLAISDPFIYKSVNPAFVYSQINQIRAILKNNSARNTLGIKNEDVSKFNYNLPL